MSHCCQQTVVGWGEGPQQNPRVQLSKSNSLMSKAVSALQQSWGGSWGSWGSRGTALLALQWGEVWGYLGHSAPPALLQPLPHLCSLGSFSAPTGTLGCCMKGVTVPPPTQCWSPCQRRRCLLFYPTPLFSPSPLHLQRNSPFPTGATLQPWGPPCMSDPQGR